jgi:hypothetical protein
LQPERLGLERLHRHTAMGDKQAAKASEEMIDPNFLSFSGKGLHDLPASHWL